LQLKASRGFLGDDQLYFNFWESSELITAASYGSTEGALLSKLRRSLMSENRRVSMLTNGKFNITVSWDVVDCTKGFEENSASTFEAEV